MMKTEMVFGGNLEIEDLTTGNRPRVKLLEPFPFWVSHKGHEKTLTIPRGFMSDCATTPWILWRIAPPFGPWNRAVVVHDFLCDHGKGSARVLDWPDPLSSVDAAEWFEAGLVACNLPRWRVAGMFHAVQWFGPHWKG
jgi:hypothetical protein